MPYIITNPETKVVTQTLVIDNAHISVSKERTVDHVTIDQVTLDMPLNNPAGISIHVCWTVGYMDGDVLFPVEQGQARLDKATAGAALFSAMGAPVTADASHYSDFKGALYGLLLAKGLIPDGTIV